MAWAPPPRPSPWAPAVPACSATPIFFSEKVLSQVYAIAPYSSHGQPDTSHVADTIFAQAGGDKAVVKLARRKNGRRGFTGKIALGVAT